MESKVLLSQFRKKAEGDFSFLASKMNNTINSIFTKNVLFLQFDIIWFFSHKVLSFLFFCAQISTSRVSKEKDTLEDFLDH
jgi:hypothetical protein